MGFFGVTFLCTTYSFIGQEAEEWREYSVILFYTNSKCYKVWQKRKLKWDLKTTKFTHALIAPRIIGITVCLNHALWKINVIVLECQVIFPYFSIFKLGDTRSQWILNALLNSKIATGNKKEYLMRLTGFDRIWFDISWTWLLLGQRPSTSSLEVITQLSRLRQGHNYVLNWDSRWPQNTHASLRSSNLI